MRDREIRDALRRRLWSAHCRDADTLILDELGLCRGNARVDIAVINGALNGYEIKSPSDTLERLPAQELIYSRILDTVTIVANPGHLSNILELVPDWWGIQELGGGRGDVRFRSVRRARQNPAVDPLAVAQLLWRDEALSILAERGMADGLRSKPRRVLWIRIAEYLPLSELAAEVRSRLRARANWRSAELRT